MTPVALLPRVFVRVATGATHAALAFARLSLPTARAVPFTATSSIHSSGSLAKSSPVDEDPVAKAYFASGSFARASYSPFSPDVIKVLQRPVNSDEVDLRPDGLVFIPPGRFADVLDEAFGPDSWELEPRSETYANKGHAGGFAGRHPKATTLSREYALLVHGRFVAQARGQHTIWHGGETHGNEEHAMGRDEELEEVRLNALTRCCKDLCINSELWLPDYGNRFRNHHGIMIWAKNIVSGDIRKIWKRKGRKLQYPYEEIS